MKKLKNYVVPQITDLRDMIRKSSGMFTGRSAFRIKNKAGEISDISYGQFKSDIDSFGTALYKLGLKDKFICVIGENRYEWCMTYLSIAGGLGIIAPLDKELPSVEIANLINRCGAVAIIYSSKYEKNIFDVKQEIPSIKHFINMDAQEDSAEYMSFSKLVTEGRRMIDNGDESYLTLPVAADRMCTLLFTSGTTDLAKGVMLNHTNLTSNMMSVHQFIRLDENDRSLSMLPMHHTYECTLGFLLFIYIGGTISFVEGIKYISQNLSEYKPTIMITVPLILESMYKKIWTQAAKDKKLLKKLKLGLKISGFLYSVLKIDMRKKLFHKVHESFGGELRLIVSGAAAINPIVSKGMRKFGFTVLQGYGLTECSPLVTGNREEFFRDDSIGLAIPGVEVRIADPGPDGIGEIAVRGKNVMMGYYNNQEATEKVLRDGWFYTGDLACMNKNGFFKITGRVKNVIVTKNGKKIFPEEVESYLYQSPLIQECMVWAKIDEDTGESYVNVSIFPNLDAIKEKFKLPSISPEDLNRIFKDIIKSVNQNMPLYKRISAFNLRDNEFVKTTTKKIKRFMEQKKSSRDHSLKGSVSK